MFKMPICGCANRIQPIAMKYVGMIDKDPDLSKMIDASFLPSDLQK